MFSFNDFCNYTNPENILSALVLSYHVVVNIFVLVTLHVGYLANVYAFCGITCRLFDFLQPHVLKITFDSETWKRVKGVS